VKRQQIDMVKQRFKTSIPLFFLYNTTNIVVPNNNYTHDVDCQLELAWLGLALVVNIAPSALLQQSKVSSVETFYSIINQHHNEGG
jgi:hypothetical protein